MGDDVWLTAPQVARILAVGHKTPAALIRAGHLRGFKRNNRWLVHRNDVARFLVETPDALERVRMWGAPRRLPDDGAADRARLVAEYRPAFAPKPPGEPPRRPYRPRPRTPGLDRRNPEWLLPDEAAALLGIDEAELLARINRGDVPAYQLCGVLRLRRSELAVSQLGEPNHAG